MFSSLALFVLAACSIPALATPTESNSLHARQDPQNIVYVTSVDKHCIIVPRDAHTNVGDSEHPGGMKTYCTPDGRYSTDQGQLPSDFWSNVELKTGYGSGGGKYVQLTGCIRPEKLSRLNPADYGGQYDSAGGASHAGNPSGSQCLGYNYYVELLEPAGPRACIRCCNDAADCPTNKDTSGCPAVIPGNYFNCG